MTEVPSAHSHAIPLILCQIEGIKGSRKITLDKTHLKTWILAL